MFRAYVPQEMSSEQWRNIIENRRKIGKIDIPDIDTQICAHYRLGTGTVVTIGGFIYYYGQQNNEH